MFSLVKNLVLILIEKILVENFAGKFPVLPLHYVDVWGILLSSVTSIVLFVPCSLVLSIVYVSLHPKAYCIRSLLKRTQQADWTN